MHLFYNPVIMLDINKTVLVVVDVQGKLAELMYEKQALFKNIAVLIQTAQALNIPVIWCEQNPHALGPTVEPLRQLLSDGEPIKKFAFSCMGEQEFQKQLSDSKRKQTILCGIETHVCIYQTAMDLLGDNCDVYVIADAVSSRTKQNRDIALNTMQAKGINIASTEMAMFELLKTAKHEKFRQLARLIK